jgi:hypothetical protein
MNHRLVSAAGAAVIAVSAFAIIEMACTKDSAAATAPSTKSGSVVGMAAGPHIDGNHFTIDAIAGDCAAGGSCAVTVKLVAQADYHINQQYPYKFTAIQAPGVTFLGTDTNGPHIFTKTGGDFAINDEKTGTMTVKFKPGAKGALSIGGTFKLSVCSAQNCQLEQQDIAVNVTVK